MSTGSLIDRVTAAAADARAYAQQVAADKLTCQGILSQIRDLNIPSINTAKEAIRQAIVAKGVACPEGTALSEFAAKIGNIVTGGGQQSLIDMYVIDQYTPFRASYTVPNSIVISGIPSEIDGQTTGYELANGTYNVTTETQNKSEFERVYKHSTQNYWFVYFNDEYNGSGMCCAIVDEYQLPSPSVWSCLVYRQGTNLTDNTTWNMQSMYYWSGTLTLEVTTTTVPQQNQVLTGRLITSYNVTTRELTIASSSTNLTKPSNMTPLVNHIYIAENATIAGNPIDINQSFPGYGALFAVDASRGVNDLINNIVPTIAHYENDTEGVLYGNTFVFDKKRGLRYSIGSSLNGLKDFTVELDFTITGAAGGYYCGLLMNRTTWTTDAFGIHWGRGGVKPSMLWNNHGIDAVTGGDDHPEWINDGLYHHVALVRKGSRLMLFSDGILIASRDNVTTDLNLAVEQCLTIGIQLIENHAFPGNVRHCRIVPFALYTDDFSNMLPIWVGYRDPLIIATSAVTLNARNGEAKSLQLVATASNGNTVSFALQDGSSLPTGLSLSSSGLISGTPTVDSTGTAYVVASATGCPDFIFTINYSVVTSSLPQSNINNYNIGVEIGSGDERGVSSTYVYDSSSSSGETTYVWNDISGQSYLIFIYQPTYSGSGMGAMYDTNHKWTFYQFGSVIFYCDDDDPTSGQWYDGSGNQVNYIELTFTEAV